MAEETREKTKWLSWVWQQLAVPAKNVHMITANSIVTSAVIYAGVLIVLFGGLASGYLFLVGPYWSEVTEQIRLQNSKFAVDNDAKLRRFTWVDQLMSPSRVDLLFAKIDSGPTTLRVMWTLAGPPEEDEHPAGMIEKEILGLDTSEIVVVLTSEDFGSAWAPGNRLSLKLIQIDLAGTRHERKNLVRVRIP